MKFGVLGTGMVGATIASKLVSLGHAVKMGAREAGSEKAVAWAQQAGDGASEGSFADAAAFGEIVFNCTLGTAALAALEAAGADNLAGKIVVDLTNPLDFSRGMPPTLFIVNDDSLGEQIQRAFPRSKVVKTLNTVGAPVMVDPGKLGGGDHDMFISGDDAEAKAVVVRILKEEFGWRRVIDLGGIATARGTETYLPLWLRLWGALGSPNFNLKIVQ